MDDYRNRYGVEPICKQLQVAPSTYYAHRQERDSERRSNRAKRDQALKPEIERVWLENFRVYGAWKVWLQLNREAIEVARCTVQRVMKVPGIQGVRRGRKIVTTVPNELLERPRDAR